MPSFDDDECVYEYRLQHVCSSSRQLNVAQGAMHKLFNKVNQPIKLLFCDSARKHCQDTSQDASSWMLFQKNIQIS
jgi:hypothetical protein